MLRTFITLDPYGVVTFVISATVAAGFFPAPRDDIQVGDVLTDEELADLGLTRAVDTPVNETLPPETPPADEPATEE